MIPILAQTTIRELETLFLASPMKVKFRPFRYPNFSSIVIRSAIIWVGWNWSVKPFHTGTPEYFASSSTMDWSKPLYSMPSNILPSTRAVSGRLSFFPIWLLPGSR